jgi:hypothetical protein
MLKRVAKGLMCIVLISEILLCIWSDFLLVVQAEGFWPPEAVMDMLKKVDVATLELQYKAQKAAAASA